MLTCVFFFQFYYFGVIYRKFKSMSTWGDSLKAVFYGPGWSPGTGRLGDPDTFPDIKAPRIKHNEPQLAKWKIAYTTFHVSLLFLLQQYLVTLLPVSETKAITIISGKNSKTNLDYYTIVHISFQAFKLVSPSPPHLNLLV